MSQREAIEHDPSSSEGISGESSSEKDSTHESGNYLVAGTHSLGLPAWAIRCKGGHEQLHLAWKAAIYSNFKDSSGIHLHHKVRGNILDEYYIVVSSSSSPPLQVCLAKSIAWPNTSQ